MPGCGIKESTRALELWYLQGFIRESKKSTLPHPSHGFHHGRPPATGSALHAALQGPSAQCGKIGSTVSCPNPLDPTTRQLWQMIGPAGHKLVSTASPAELKQLVIRAASRSPSGPAKGGHVIKAALRALAISPIPPEALPPIVIYPEATAIAAAQHAIGSHAPSTKASASSATSSQVKRSRQRAWALASCVPPALHAACISKP